MSLTEDSRTMTRNHQPEIPSLQALLDGKADNPVAVPSQMSCEMRNMDVITSESSGLLVLSIQQVSIQKYPSLSLAACSPQNVSLQYLFFF